MEDSSLSSLSCVSFPDSPVIEQEQTHIKTGGGEEIHITCRVEAQPPPTVDWYRDGSLLSVSSPGVVMNQAGQRYNLIILGNCRIISPSPILIFTIISPLFLSLFIQYINECLNIFFKAKFVHLMLTGQWSAIWSWSRPSQYEQFIQHLTCSD